jgi:hypothetical protein
VDVAPIGGVVQISTPIALNMPSISRPVYYSLMRDLQFREGTQPSLYWSTVGKMTYNTANTALKYTAPFTIRPPRGGISSEFKHCVYSALPRISIRYMSSRELREETDWVLLTHFGTKDYKFLSVLNEKSDHIIQPNGPIDFTMSNMYSASANTTVVYTEEPRKVERIIAYTTSEMLTKLQETYIEYVSDLPFRATTTYYAVDGMMAHRIVETFNVDPVTDSLLSSGVSYTSGPGATGGAGVAYYSSTEIDVGAIVKSLPDSTVGPVNATDISAVNSIIGLSVTSGTEVRIAQDGEVVNIPVEMYEGSSPTVGLPVFLSTSGKLTVDVPQPGPSSPYAFSCIIGSVISIDGSIIKTQANLHDPILF